MIISELFEEPQQCPECGGISFSDLILAEKKDACYHKVKASAKVWPSAYASGRLVQCRKKGAANYGNKSEGVAEGSLEEIDRRGFLKGLGAAAVAGAAGSAMAKRNNKLDDPMVVYLIAWCKIVSRAFEKYNAPKFTKFPFKEVYNISHNIDLLDAEHGSEDGKLDFEKWKKITYKGYDDAQLYLKPYHNLGPQNMTVDYLFEIYDKLKVYYSKLNNILTTKESVNQGVAEGGDVFMANIKNTPEYRAGFATGKLPVPHPEGTQEYANYYKGVIDKASPTLSKVGEDDANFGKSAALMTPSPQAAQKAKDIVQQRADANVISQAKIAGVVPITREGEQKKGADYRDPKEVDYDDEYDAMVARVKRLAGLGPLKTVYDPNKRVYRNMPTAVQPKK